MRNPFAAIESTLASVSLAAVSNANLIWKGTTIAGVFDSLYIDTLGMANSAPNFACGSVAVAAMLTGDVVSVVKNGVTVAYTVREIQPDGRGITRLVLETA